MSVTFNAITSFLRIPQQQKELNKDIFWLLLSPMVMKAVLSNNSGKKYKDSISKINAYFKDNDLFIQAKSLHDELNAHNSSMLIRRISKDWKNYFSSLKDLYNGNPKGLTGKPSYPKLKKLSKVFNYSLPLEPSKFSLKKLKKGLLGINVGKKMFYTYIGKNIDYIQDKTINNVTISYSHGHIYYLFTYIHNDKLTIDKELNLSKKKVIKEAGADVGINNLLSLFINDNTTQSLIISGKELISDEVSSYKTIIGINNQPYEVPESYTELGKNLIHSRGHLFERRKLYLDDYLNKMSKKVLTYLSLHKVNVLVLSKNLSFTKTTGEIKIIKKTKQKFYQIPFGKLLTLIDNKSSQYGIEIKYIDEAYNSKTSSISADVYVIQKKDKELREKESKNHI